MKKSFASRSIKLLGLAAQVGREELTQSLKEKFNRGMEEMAPGRLKTRIEQAKLIAESLSQLKGAAMKAGQLLSLDASDFFPPEAIEILSKLQGKAEPVPWAEMREVVVSDLGEEKLSQLEDLQKTAAASASIGQVHKAKLFNEEVAIKIQYPGVADSIDSDLKILKTMAQGLATVAGKKMSLEELFKELADVLKQEADYELEFANMEKFRNLASGIPELIVPIPVASHSAKHVLTMSWENGVTITDWLKSQPTMKDRETVARLILDLYCKEFFEWGLVQTDPNFGNFLVQTDPLKLVLLDFGAALAYTSEFRREYVALLQTLATLDRQKIVRAFVDFGLMDPRESDEAKELFFELLTLSLEPFQPSKQPFKFKDDDYAKRSREVGQRFTQSLKYTPPPRKILFLHRKLGGIFQLLKKMDVQLDVSPYWNRMIGAEIES